MVQLRRLGLYVASFAWCIESLLRLDWLRSKTPLLVYDLRFFNCSAGDIFLEAALAVLETDSKKQKRPEMIFVVPDQPPFYRMGEKVGEYKVNPSNFSFYLNEVTLIAEYCGARSTHIYYSEFEALKHLQRGRFRYHYRPSLRRWWFTEYIWKFVPKHRWSFDHYLALARKYGIWQPQIRRPFVDWYSHFRKSVGGPIVALCFRMNSPNDIDRNTPNGDLELVLEALSKRPDLKCVIVGDQVIEDYLPSHLLSRVHVISSRKLGLTVFQELLLIQNAEYVIGSNTGPMTARLITDKPYLMLDYRSAEITAVSEDYYGKSQKNPLGIQSQNVLHYADRLPHHLKKQSIEDYLDSDSTVRIAANSIDQASLPNQETVRKRSEIQRYVDKI
jgi:hypothetical protein